MWNCFEETKHSALSIDESKALNDHCNADQSYAQFLVLQKPGENEWDVAADEEFASDVDPLSVFVMEHVL